MLAPIALFVYNRLAHARQTVEALKKNLLADQSELFIFSDGAKNANEEPIIKDVRNYLKSINGFKNLTIIERPENWGLAQSLTQGITEIIQRYGKIIVLEDDLVTSPYFLTFLNDALEVYQNETQVMHLSAYFPPTAKKLPATFFYNQASCWGWATWQRAWQHFNPDARQLVKKISEQRLVRQLNIDNNFNFFSTLKANAEGRIKTWAVKWHATIILEHGFCLHPGQSLVRNIGSDNSGEHPNFNQALLNQTIYNNRVPVENMPLAESSEAKAAAVNFLNQLKPSLIRRLLNKLKTVL